MSARMIHTSTGCRFFIGPVAGTSVVTESDFEALTFIEISQIQDLGDFGDAAEDISFAVVNDDRLHYRKGAVDGGVMPLILSYDPDDDGQTALKTASASRSNFAFKIELGGVPGVPPAEEVFSSVVKLAFGGHIQKSGIRKSMTCASQRSCVR